MRPINKYLEFIESGQIYEDYPDAKEKELRIDVISKYDFTELGNNFIRIANDNLTDSGLCKISQYKHNDE